VTTATLNISDNETVDSQTNPVHEPATFVCQLYHDFLHRQPDPAGHAFWTNEITQCGSNQGCVSERRHNVAAAFFLSIEFQQTGFLAYLANRAAFGNSAAAPQVPVSYARFQRDVQALQRGFVFGRQGADAVLEANRRAYFDEFVTRPEFAAKYEKMSSSDYVTSLLVTANASTTVANVHVARLDAAQQSPPNSSPARGVVIVRRSPFADGDPNVYVSLSLSNLTSPVTAVHIHGPAAPGAEAPVLFTLPAGEFADFRLTPTPEQLRMLGADQLYIDVHTQNNPGGEIRAQISTRGLITTVLRDALDNAILTRAQVFRIVAESEELKRAEFRRAFVLMQYFGYLRRDPDAEGFNFWLSKLDQFNGDFVAAEMVKAFLNSDEYRKRFGQ
jgi:hypothetical protein